MEIARVASVSIINMRDNVHKNCKQLIFNTWLKKGTFRL